MFGSEYFNHPEILLESFSEMTQDYNQKTKKKQNNSVLFLQKLYIKIFGIPEIGFQIRSLYFKQSVMQNVRKRKIKNILDAGSGIGAYSFWLRNKYKNAQIKGVDVDKEKLRFSNQFVKEINSKGISFSYADISKSGKKNRYDLIINIDVLEHIKNYKIVLKNFYDHLNKTGYLYIHAPQINQKRFFKKLNNWSHEDHTREGFNPKVLRKELESLGFKIIVEKNTFGTFGKLAWELNHVFLSKGFIVAGLTYPILLIVAQLDIMWKNNEGLGISILAEKP